MQRQGLSFDYVNSFQEHKQILAEKLSDSRIHTIAITTTLYFTTEPIAEIVQFIRQYNQDAVIIAGGPFIASQIRIQDTGLLNYLFNYIGADVYVNSNEGELTLTRIIDAVKNSAAMNSITNIYYKENNQFIKTQEEPENNILDKNMVNWSLFREQMGDKQFLRTAKSCPFTCSFCNYPTFGGKFQTVNLEAIIYELDLIKKLNKTKWLHFVDDSFNVPKPRFKELLKLMIKRDYQFKWASFLRCQFLDEETVKLMKESGCQYVFLGLESGNDNILEKMNKKTTVSKYKKGIELLAKYGIITFGSFIIGFPGETEKTVQDTNNLIKMVDFYTPANWLCLPDAPIIQEKDKYSIKGLMYNWQHCTMDSYTSCQIIDDLFLHEKDSVYLPKFDLDATLIMYLLAAGINRPQIKDFIRAFNEGVKETVFNEPGSEIGTEYMDKLKNSNLHHQKLIQF